MKFTAIEQQKQAVSSWSERFDALTTRLVKTELTDKDKAEVIQLLLEQPAVFYQKIDRDGLLERLFPELAAMKGLEQDPLKHAEGDVDQHNRLLMGALAQSGVQASPGLVLGALLHDVEKRSTQGRDVGTGRITFHKHAKAGVATVDVFAQRWNVSGEVAQETRWLVEHHTDLFLPSAELARAVATDNIRVTRLLTDPPVEWSLNLLRLMRADSMASWREGSRPGHPVVDTDAVDFLTEQLPAIRARAAEREHHKKRLGQRSGYISDALGRGVLHQDPAILATARQILDGHVKGDYEQVPTHQLDRLARKAISVEAFRTQMELTELTEQRSKELFDLAFAESGTAEKLALLDQKGVLERIVPEFQRNRDLTQDERWHGQETVGEHSLQAVAFMDDLIDQGDAFADPRFEKLLRFGAFFHDMGKNMDPDKDPKVVGKEGLGYRHADQRAGEEFQRVRFLGHAGVGAAIAEKRLKELQVVQQGDARLTDLDISLVSLWVRHHMRAVDVTRDLERADADELADRILKDAYPIACLNERIPIGEAVRAAMLVQEMELRLSQPSKERKQWEEGWSEVKKAVAEKLPVLESQNKDRLITPLLEGGDLTELGVPELMRKAIRQEVFNKQKTGEIVTRAGALQAAIEMATFLSSEQGKAFQPAEEALVRALGKGAQRSFTMRMENLKTFPPEERGGYAVYRYESQPLREFDKTTPLTVIEGAVFSGNFPNLAKHLREEVIPIEVVKELLTDRGFANLIQLEDFVRSHGVMGEKLSNVKRTRAPLTRKVEIKRVFPHGKDPRKVVVQNGYQGIKDHTGSGSIHIDEQRLDALQIHFKRPGESEPEMLDRFFEEVVVHVVGTAPLEMPSHYDPKRFKLLTGAVKGSSDQFASIILDTEGVHPRVETVLFHETKIAMRKDFVRKLKKLRELKSVEVDLSQLLEDTNQLLLKYELEKISEQELESAATKVQPATSKSREPTKEKKPEQIKYADLKAVGFTDPQAGALMSKLRPELKKADIQSPIDMVILEKAKIAFDTQDIDGAVRCIIENMRKGKNAEVPD